MCSQTTAKTELPVRRVSFAQPEAEQPLSPRSDSPEAGSLPRASPTLDGPPAELVSGSIVDSCAAAGSYVPEAPDESKDGLASVGQYLLSRRFRDPGVETEYLEWHFSIWGRRTALFACFFAVLALGNLCIVLVGTSTRRRAG